MVDEPKAKAAPGWYPRDGHPGQLRRWNGHSWTGETRPLRAPRGRTGLRRGVIWFCVGLGAAAFLLLANLSVSATGYDCGSVMGPKSYEGRSAYEFDPTDSLGSDVTEAAEATSQMKADAQNEACASAVGSRQTFAIVAGLVVLAVAYGGARVFGGDD